ncbi:MAG: DUF4174 domain-containing protein [Desulfovermiculus sp.]|nr:DUF4174 domain-containing protein [Desulfovermiculus sp.]
MMKAIFVAVLLLGLTAGWATWSWSMDLQEYRWKNRLLLVFSPSDTDQTYLELQQALGRAEDRLQDRDMVVFHLFPSGRGKVDGACLSEKEVRSLFQRFDVSDHPLTVILIGKDGGEKARQVGRFDLQAVFDRIDAMPMRQREMRQQSRGD